MESIKRVRKRAGLSLPEMAARTGLHREGIARVERAGTDLRVSTLAAVAKALRVPVCELFKESDMSDERSGGDRGHPRGIFERPKGSGVWWTCYFDEHGRKHREKVGPKALAMKVYQNRKTEIQERHEQRYWDRRAAA